MDSKGINIRLQAAERDLQDLKSRATELEDRLAALRALAEAPDPKPASPAPPIPPPLPEVTAAPAPAVIPTPPPAPAPTSAAGPSPAPVQITPPVEAATTPSEAPARTSSGLEMELGRVWFVRIGIGLLLTGFVFLSTYAYQNYIVHWGPGFRVTALYLAATLLTVTGIFLESWKESLRSYGRVVAAGGWAALYYTTYAAHHVERLQIIESPVVAAVALSLAALAFFSYAAWKKSPVLTVGALGMAFYSIAINPMGWLGCFSALLLSAIGLFFFVRYQWMQTGLTALLGAYLSYTYWQAFVNPEAISDPTRWFLVGYWILFTAGILAPQARSQDPRLLGILASINNIFFFVLFSFDFHTLSWVPQLSIHALGFGAVLIAIAASLRRLGNAPPQLTQVFLGKGLALVTWGLSLELTGYHLFISLTLEALILAFLWRRSQSILHLAFAGIATLLATGFALEPFFTKAPLPPDAAYLVLGGLLVVLGWLLRPVSSDPDHHPPFSVLAAIPSALALTLPSAAILPQHGGATAGLWMLGIGLVLWAAYLAIPARWPLIELSWLAQPYAIAGGALLLIASPTLGQLAAGTVLTAIAFHLHGWAADRKTHTPFPEASRFFEAVLTSLSLLLLGSLVFRGIDSPNLRLLVYALLPVALHIHGSLLARPFLSASSQAFWAAVIWISALNWIGIGSSLEVLDNALLVTIGIAFGHLAAIHFWPRLLLRPVLRETHLLLAIALWAGWCISTIEPWWLVLAWTGCALMFVPASHRARVHEATALTLLAGSLLALSLLERTDFWLRYLALPAPFLAHFLWTRKTADPGHRIATVHLSLAILTMASLTVVASQHTLQLFDGRGLSVCWALLAMALFGLGLATRIRAYRLGGLALLALSLAHVLTIDVWKLDTIPRIVSFMTLGLVLLVLGFVYNRFHRSIRKLL